MMGWKRLLRWGSLVVAGLALVGLGVFFTSTGLDKADRWASVIGVFVALIGLGLSVYGVVLARRASTPVAGAQRVDRVDAQRGVDVIDSVRGSVRLGTSTPSVSPPPSPASPPAAASSTVVPGEQSVSNVRAGGAVRVIRGVDGDVDAAS